MTAEEIQTKLADAQTRKDAAIAEKADLLEVQIPAAIALQVRGETGQQKSDRIQALHNQVHGLREQIRDLELGGEGESRSLADQLAELVRRNPYAYTVTTI